MTPPDPRPAARLQQFAGPQPSATPQMLDRYDIAVVLTAIYEWGGYRYSSPSDAIAAAKRAAR